MYIIPSGQIQIHKGKTMLALLQEKEVFGELSLLDAETRSDTATAKTNCNLSKIDQELFTNSLIPGPKLRGPLLKFCVPG